MSLKANISQVRRRLELARKGLSGSGLRQVGEEARELLLSDARRAFSTRSAPSGRPWKGRKGSYPWPLMNKTGQTRGAVRARVWHSGATLRVRLSAAPGQYSDGRKKPVNLGLILGVAHFGSPKQARRPIFGISKTTSKKVRALALSKVKK